MKLSDDVKTVFELLLVLFCVLLFFPALAIAVFGMFKLLCFIGGL